VAEEVRMLALWEVLVAVGVVGQVVDRCMVQDWVAVVVAVRVQSGQRYLVYVYGLVGFY
jgi:hypothetical protein